MCKPYLSELQVCWISLDGSISLLISSKCKELFVPHTELVLGPRDSLPEHSDGRLDVATICRVSDVMAEGLIIENIQY